MTTRSSKYRLLEKFRSVFEGVAYRHRASTTGDSVAIELYEDLYDLGKSPKLTNRIDNRERVVNVKNTR